MSRFVNLELGGESENHSNRTKSLLPKSEGSINEGLTPCGAFLTIASCRAESNLTADLKIRPASMIDPNAPAIVTPAFSLAA